MRQRGVTVLVGFLLMAGLTVLVGQAQVPYVQIEPGPTYDTLGQDDDGKDIIVVGGADATESAGQLRFVTIGVRSDLSLLEALIGWWNGDEAVVPRELIYPPNETKEEVDKRNKEDFANSESAAQTAALTKLGYKPKIAVKEVASGTPADGKLKAGDVINTVDGTEITGPEKLLEILRGKPAGTTFAFGVTRDKTQQTIQVATAAGEDGVPRVGVTQEITTDAPFTLDIPIENIGGPSAGLMLALGIIDTIQTDDLTGGKIIAGTGTIDASGTVGPIGGVPQKLVAAKDAGATWFLTPKDNCEEAVANQKDGLTLVQVATLDEALTALQQIREGGTPTLCSGARSN